MEKIYFVTGNNNKFLSANRNLAVFSILLEQKSLPIIEMQNENIEQIAIDKVNQAFFILKRPVIVSDTGWSIASLNGFPGPFMHYISEWFTGNDLLQLLQNKQNRSVTMCDVLVYKDRNITKVFTMNREGNLLHELKGEGVAIDCIASFRADHKTIAECQALAIPFFDANDQTDSVWHQFGQWLLSYASS
jgi:XTP/dITP diphosphohydrolase